MAVLLWDQNLQPYCRSEMRQMFGRSPQSPGCVFGCQLSWSGGSLGPTSFPKCRSRGVGESVGGQLSYQEQGQLFLAGVRDLAILGPAKLSQLCNPNAREAETQGSREPLDQHSLIVEFQAKGETLSQRRWTMFLRTTPEVVLWPPHACAHENTQMWTHILTHFCPCIHNIHVYKKQWALWWGKMVCHVLLMSISQALKKLSLFHTMEWTFGLHDCPSIQVDFQSTCSLLPMTQILYHIFIFIPFLPLACLLLL